ETSALDPIVMASAYHHAFLRGGIVAEPLWLFKGVSYRSESYGAFRYEYQIKDDHESPNNPTMTDLLIGNPKRRIREFDMVAKKAQARTHCVLSTTEQAAEDLIATGHRDRVKDIVVLWDACSDIPGFEADAQKRWDALKEKGVRIETTETFNLYDLAA